jgi:hypothetical protein
MGNIWGTVCLGAFLFAPIITFVVGYLIGADKLPYKLRIERNKKYEVDV